MNHQLRRIIAMMSLVFMLIIVSSPLSAADFNVACDTTELTNAITAANATPEADTINLAASCVYSFTTEDASDNNSALPTVTTDIIINGNGATLARDASAPQFRLIYMTSGSLTLKNLTLTGGNLPYSITPLDGAGGGVYVAGGTLTLNKVTMSGNTGGREGGAVYMQGGGILHIVNSLITGNKSVFGGGINSSGNALSIDNSIISGNKADLSGGGLYNNATTMQVITNSVIAGNSANIGGGIQQSTGLGITVTNSIIWGNSSQTNVSSGTLTISYSTIEGGYGGTGNLSSDPLFVNHVSHTSAPTATGDYHLKPNSPAINVGDNASLALDTYDVDGDSDTGETLPIDIDGDSRVLYTTVDMGADEVDCSSYLAPNIIPSGDTAALTSAIQCANITTGADVINLTNSTYTFTTEDASDNNSALPTVTTSITINGNGATLARDASAPQFRLIHLSADTLTLKNLIITGGNLPYSITPLNGSGGGVYVAGGTLILNTVTMSGNQAGATGGAVDTHGGGILHIVNSVLSNNRAAFGGALYTAGNALTVDNSIISGNKADATSGGILNSATTIQYITNSVIAGNTSTNSGGGVRQAAGPGMVITNSIIWGNSSQIQVVGGSMTVSYSTVEGGYTGTGNLSSDPLFINPIAYSSAPTSAGDYHLKPNSPMINMGDNASLPLDTYDVDGDSDTGETLPIDLDGDSRIIGGQTDIGADELDPCDAANFPYTVPASDTAAFVIAIECANKDSDESVIINIGEGTYMFTEPASGGGNSALPVITRRITLNGLGSGAILQREASASPFRLITIDGGIVVVNNLTLLNGSVFPDIGGAISANNTVMTIINSTLSGNSANNGGAVFFNGGSLNLVNTVISGNSAVDTGSAIHTTGSTTVEIHNSTIAGNTSINAGLVTTDGFFTITNSILWGNSSGIVDSEFLSVTYSLIEGGFEGEGNLNADPLFVTPIAYTSAPTTTGDYHLQAGSPAINAGNNAALPLDTYDIDDDSDTGETLPIDIDGNARVLYTSVDVGADEYQDICDAYIFPYTVPAADSAALLTAVTCANRTSDTDIINLTASIYNFTSVMGDDSALAIYHPLTLNGNGATLRRDDAAPQLRLVYTNAVDVRLNDLTITNGLYTAGGSGGGLRVGGGILTLDDVSITGNNVTGVGGGVYVVNDGTLYILNSTISGNTGLQGGGIFTLGSVSVLNSTVSGNVSTLTGGGIRVDGAMTVINSTISGNSAGSNGGGITAGTEGSLSLINSVVSGNTSNTGGGVYFSNNLTNTIVNSTIAGNNATSSGGGIYRGIGSGAVTVTNSIVWGNSAAQIVESPGTITVDYSTVEGGFTGTGNLSNDPLFVNPIAYASAPTMAGDYHIQTGSPAINAGSNAALPADIYDIDGDSDTAEVLPIDIDGESRVDFGVVDIGADEYVFCEDYASPYTVPAGDTFALSKAIECANFASGGYTINLTNSLYTFSVADSTNSDSALPRINVALLTINGNGATIERAEGSDAFRLMYVSGGTLNVQNLTLSNGYLNVDNRRGAGLYIEGNANVTLNHVTLTGHDNGASIGGFGGAANVASGTLVLINSAVTGNSAVAGGGLSSNGTVVVINSTITNNQSNVGGGGITSIGGQLTVINSILSGNRTGFNGGAIFASLNATVTIENSTLAGNQGSGGGIFTITGASATIENSIIWGNSSQLSGDNITATYSLIEGGYAGDGNLDADPLFVNPIPNTSAPTADGDYHLQTSSPVLNVGNDAALPLDVYDIDGDNNTTEVLPIDIDGNSRILNTHVEMGADEVDITCVEPLIVAAGDTARLRETITCANANPDLTTIQLSAGTYTFTEPDAPAGGGALPSINTPVILKGLGTGALLQRAAGSPQFRLLGSDSATVVIINLTLSGGSMSTDVGGAIYSGNSTFTIINSSITGNSANNGGAIYLERGSLTLINSVVSGNSATNNGGGITGIFGGTLTVQNSTIAGNNAMGDGGGINADDLNLTVVNSIIWGNSSSISGFADVSYSLIEGDFTGTGNLSADPLFGTPIAYGSAPTAIGDYQLQTTSPAIDAAEYASLPFDTYDIDGDSDTAERHPFDRNLSARLTNLTLDMGAYESTTIINYLTNGGFETAGNTAKLALKWMPTRIKTTDKRLCSKVSKPITTAEGNCVFQFSGGNSLDSAKRGIKQTITTPSWATAGRTLRIAAFIEGNKLKTGSKITLTLTYTDDTTGKVTITIPKGTYSFGYSYQDLFLTKDAKKLVVSITMGKTGGRLRIDAVQLNVSDPDGRSIVTEPTLRDGASVLPLPEVPDGFRGGN